MRKAAGIILIAFGAYFLWILIDVLVLFGISGFHTAFYGGIERFYTVVVVLILIVSAAFPIAGGIFGLRRKCWRVCLASASFTVLLSVLDSPRSLLALEIVILRSWVNWVMVAVAVVAVIFIVLTKKEWQEILA